jgi:hypothetical protein
MIDFDAPDWLGLDDARRQELGVFLDGAIERVIEAGLLPTPPEPLLPVGARVEALVIGGKPGPPEKYGTGSVSGHSWCSVFRCWRIEVRFDKPAGTYYGGPINGTSTFVNMVHVIGTDEPPYSSMTPSELEARYEDRRQEFWRTADQAAGADLAVAFRQRRCADPLT